MNKQEFIKELEYCLRHLPKEDRDDAVSYYTEYLGDMDVADYEDVTAKLGTPKEVAKNIIDNCTAKAVEEQKENRTVKGSGKVVWLVILGIFSLPLSLPLAITVFTLAFALIVVVFSLLFAFGVTGVSLVIAGIFAFFKSFFVGGLASIAVGIGGSMVIAGVGALLMVSTVELFKVVVGTIGRIFSKRRNKKEEN